MPNSRIRKEAKFFLQASEDQIAPEDVVGKRVLEIRRILDNLPPGSRINAQELADRFEISTNWLNKIMVQLRQGGWKIDSAQGNPDCGAHTGYKWGDGK